MGLETGTADIIRVSDIKANFTGNRIRPGMLAMTSDTFQIVKRDLVSSNYTFFSDDSKQMLLATDQEASGKKTFNSETLIKGLNKLHFNSVADGGSIEHDATDLIIKNNENVGGNGIVFQTVTGNIIFKPGGITLLTIEDSTVALSSGIPLKLGNAKVGSGDVAINGSVTIKDSTGATIKLATVA